MTVLLMLTMFVAFIAIDYFLKRGHVSAEALDTESAQPATPVLPPAFVAGFDLPANRSYHQGHTWALAETPAIARVGLDDFGARLAGKIDSIVLPKRGQWIRQGQKFATMIRDGRKTDLVSPVEGEVTNINETLSSDISLTNRDPYGEGWLVSVMTPDQKTTFRNLLNGSLARKWMADAASRLQARIPAYAGAVAQDGGVAVHDLTLQMPTEKWEEITREFFLT